jgi:hypothetical protein
MPNRIIKLSWKHNGMKMHCEVGRALPAYYETGFEPVLEIIDCGDHYSILTESRGGTFGSAIRAGKDRWSKATTLQDGTKTIKKQNTLSQAFRDLADSLPEEAEAALVNIRTEEGIIDRVFSRAAEVMESQENAITWLTTSNYAFAGKRPIDLLFSTSGALSVLDELGRLQHGLPSC